MKQSELNMALTLLLIDREILKQKYHIELTKTKINDYGSYKHHVARVHKMAYLHAMNELTGAIISLELELGLR